ncbi:hypothetical protein Tco_1563642 [Tanacetum coccineum]
MATLESCPKHNMIAYLEKTEGNVEFHEVIVFLQRSDRCQARTEPSGENHEDHSSNDASLSGNEDDMTLQNVYDLCISLCQQNIEEHLIAEKNRKKSSSKEVQGIHKKNVSKQGRKIAKGESTIQRDPMFDVMPEDNIDHMEADNAQSEGRTKELVDEDKELDEDRLSTEDETKERYEEKIKSTDEQRVDTRSLNLRKKSFPSFSNIHPDTLILNIWDDETISTLLINMNIAKATSIRKKRKVKVQEEWEAEEEKNRLAEEEATNEALIKNFDEIKARIEADRILAEKLQEQEREQFTIEERAKFLHDTIAAQRKFLAQQRSEAIRNRPPTKNQLRFRDMYQS